MQWMNQLILLTQLLPYSKLDVVSHIMQMHKHRVDIYKFPVNIFEVVATMYVFKPLGTSLLCNTLQCTVPCYILCIFIKLLATYIFLSISQYSIRWSSYAGIQILIDQIWQQLYHKRFRTFYWS